MLDQATSFVVLGICTAIIIVALFPILKETIQ